MGRSSGYIAAFATLASGEVVYIILFLILDMTIILAGSWLGLDE